MSRRSPRRDPRLAPGYTSEAFKRQAKADRERIVTSQPTLPNNLNVGFSFDLDGPDVWDESGRRANGSPLYRRAEASPQLQHGEVEEARRDPASHAAADMRTHDPLLSSRLLAATTPHPHPLLASEAASTRLVLTSAPSLEHPEVVDEATTDAHEHHMPSELIQHLATRPAHPRDQHLKSPRKASVVTKAQYLLPQTKKGATPSRDEDPFMATR